MSNDLGDFLRARRAALDPAETGVPAYGSARRVPGLRREEVALLAGVSVNYYTKLEQGEGFQVSGGVLDALAGALRLGEDERRHLARLAWPAQVIKIKDDGPDTVRESLRALAESNTTQGVGIIGRRLDLLGGNRIYHELFGLRPGRTVNLAMMMFLEPAARDFWADWTGEATLIAAQLRSATSEHPDDPGLAALIGALSIRSADFARIWAAHPVAECGHRVHRIRHPRLGPLTLTDEILRVPDSPGLRLSFWTLDAASPGGR